MSYEQNKIAGHKYITEFNTDKQHIYATYSKRR